MSYICLMANDRGAVAAADSRETFHPKVHLDWRKKCFALPEQQMVWASCGPTFRLGVDLLRSTELIFRENKTMEEKLEKIKSLVNSVTRLSPWAGDPGPFCLLIARMEEGRIAVWNCYVHKGELHVNKRMVPSGEAISLHAGAHHREMPPLSTASLRELSYDQLRELAKGRVKTAIELDEGRHIQDPDHNQTIGGGIRVAGLRIKGQDQRR